MSELIMKICKVHGELDELNVYLGHSRGHKYIRCKKCKRDYEKRTKEKIKEKSRIYHAKYRKENLEKLKKYYEKNSEKRKKARQEWGYKNREYIFSKQSGISMQAGLYNELLIKQDYKCAICKNPETIMSRKRDKVKSLSIDHCHKTKKIRGLLCHKCNTSLGAFMDNIELLKNAIQYLGSI